MLTTVSSSNPTAIAATTAATTKITSSSTSALVHSSSPTSILILPPNASHPLHTILGPNVPLVIVSSSSSSSSKTTSTVPLIPTHPTYLRTSSSISSNRSTIKTTPITPAVVATTDIASQGLSNALTSLRGLYPIDMTNRISNFDSTCSASLCHTFNKIPLPLDVARDFLATTIAISQAKNHSTNNNQKQQPANHLALLTTSSTSSKVFSSQLVRPSFPSSNSTSTTNPPTSRSITATQINGSSLNSISNTVLSLSNFIVCRTAGRDTSSDGVTCYLGAGAIKLLSYNTDIDLNNTSNNKNNSDDFEVLDSRTVLLQVKDMGIFSTISNDLSSLPSIAQVLADVTLLIAPDELFQPELLSPDTEPDLERLLGAVCTTRYEYIKDFLLTEDDNIRNFSGSNKNDATSGSCKIRTCSNISLEELLLTFDSDTKNNTREASNSESVKRRRVSLNSYGLSHKTSLNNDTNRMKSALFNSKHGEFFKTIATYYPIEVTNTGSLVSILLPSKPCVDSSSQQQNEDQEQKQVLPSSSLTSMLFNVSKDKDVDDIALAIEAGLDVYIYSLPSTEESIIKAKNTNEIELSSIADKAAKFFEQYPPRSSVSVDVSWQGIPPTLLCMPPLSSFVGLDVCVFPGEIDPQNHVSSQPIRMQLETLEILDELFLAWDTKPIVRGSSLKDVIERLNMSTTVKNLASSKDFLEVDWDALQAMEDSVIEADLNEFSLEVRNSNSNVCDMSLESQESNEMLETIFDSLNKDEFNQNEFLIPKILISKGETTDFEPDKVGEEFQRSNLDFTERLVVVMQRLVFGLTRLNKAAIELRKIESAYSKLLTDLILFVKGESSLSELDIFERLRRCILLRVLYRVEAGKIKRIIEMKLSLVLDRFYRLLQSNNSFQPNVFRSNTSVFAESIREHYRFISQRTATDKLEEENRLKSLFDYYVQQDSVQLWIDTMINKLRNDYGHYFVSIGATSRAELEQLVSSAMRSLSIRNNQEDNSNDTMIGANEIDGSRRSSKILRRLHIAAEACSLIRQNVISIPSQILTPIVKHTINANYERTDSSISSNGIETPFRFKVNANKFSGKTSEDLLNAIRKSGLVPQHWSVCFSPLSSCGMSAMLLEDESGSINFNTKMESETTLSGLKGRYMIMFEKLESQSGLTSTELKSKDAEINEKTNVTTRNVREAALTTGGAAFFSATKAEIFDITTGKMIITDAIVDSPQDQQQSDLDPESIQRWRMIKSWTSVI